MHIRRLAPLLLAAGLVLAGRGGAGTAAGGGAADPNATVNVRLVLEPTSLDITKVAGAALEQLLLDNVYQTLLTRSGDQKIVPLLAASDTRHRYPHEFSGGQRQRIAIALAPPPACSTTRGTPTPGGC